MKREIRKPVDTALANVIDRDPASEEEWVEAISAAIIEEIGLDAFESGCSRNVNPYAGSYHETIWDLGWRLGAHLERARW